MKSEFIRKNKYIGIGLVCVIIIISTSIGIIFSLLPKSKLHAPIIIESDGDFLNYDLTGDGSQNNPYIIEDFRIGASGENSIGIDVTNINSFFIIKNCIIYSDLIGIELDDVATGTSWIINNTCISKTGDGAGIVLLETANCSIINNTCSNFNQGIHFNYASYCLIKSNRMENNNYQGINIRYSSYNVIINNTIKMTPQHGIVLVGNANSNKIYHNILFNNSQSDTYNVDGRLTGTINSQAFDEGNNNFWYEEVSKQGNFWSDYQGTGDYSIDGPTGTSDIYPSDID